MTDTHIKIKPVTPRVQYTGNGSTTTFPYSFAIFDETDMVVYVDDDIIESGYTVTGAGETDGGAVVFDTAPASGKKITLLRNVPIERITDFQEGGTFRPKNINDELDRQTAFVQQVQEKLDRAIVVGPTSSVDPEAVLTQVQRVYSSIDNVDAVADDITNVNTVASNISKVQTTSNNISSVNTVSGNISNVNTVAGISNNVTAVAGNSTNINAVNANKANINAVAGNATNINAVAGNATNINAVNANKTNIDTCATNIAAILDAPNQAQAAADSAALSQQYANDKINQTHISNCIVQEQQWLKISDYSGIIEVKADSYVMIPNGDNFEQVKINSNKVAMTSFLSARTAFLVYRRKQDDLAITTPIENVESGTTTPQTGWYYNVNTNKIYRDGLDEGISFPLAIITIDNSGAHIKQIFNVVGFIGSHLFILPGIKVLIPFGRNANGTLNSKEYSNPSSVLLGTRNLTQKNVNVWLNQFGTIQFSNGWIYNEAKNRLISTSDGYTTNDACHIANVDMSSGKITNLYPKRVFHDIGYNDSNEISGWSAPGKNYVEISLGASGTQYTAPANGWFAFGKRASAVGQYLNVMYDSPSSFGAWSDVSAGASGNILGHLVQVMKNQKVTVNYSAGGDTTISRFIYANGESSD